MENFVVSARKYRPATFESVVGQEHITSTLRNAISRGQLAHAYLFCGPRGVGKTTCARIFAKAINCLSPSGSEACGQCESCQGFNQGRSFNIHELDAASNNSVDDIRSLTEQVRIPPQIGRYSVYIIDEVHMLSAAAFNAFLKTLEEPPAHAVFILATTEKHKIIPTILSRCQIYDFNRIRVEDGVKYLRYIAGLEDVQCDDESLHLIAQKADGGMRDALSMFDKAVSFCGTRLDFKSVAQTLNVLDYDTYFNITDNILAGNYPAVLTALDDVLRKGFSPQTFTAGFGVHLRDLLMCRDGQTAGLLEVTGSLLERYREQAARCQTGFLFEALSLVTTLDSGLRTATNQRLNVELCLMKLCSEGQKKTPGNQPTPHPGPIEKLTLPDLRGGGAQPHMPGRHSADDPQAGASRSATGGSPQDNDPAPSADTAPVGATPSPAHGGDSPGPGPDTSRDRGSDGSKTAREGDPIPEPRPESDVTPAPDIRDTAVEGDSSITERHTAPDGKPGTENAPGARGGDHIPETHTGEKPGTGGKDTQAAAQTRPVPEGQASGSEAEPGSRTPQAEPQGKVSQSERRVGDTVRPNSAADSASGGPAPQTARKNIRSALLGPSITDLLEKPVGIYDMPPEEQGGGSALPAADPETAHKIEKHRERFLKLLGAGRPRLAVPFREMAVGGNKITVTVPTAELHDEIMRNRTEILTLLADTASVNGYIELAVEVKEDSGPKLPVRVEDKLRYLTRKNPNLNLLRQKLEMDIE